MIWSRFQWEPPTPPRSMTWSRRCTQMHSLWFYGCELCFCGICSLMFAKIFHGKFNSHRRIWTTTIWIWWICMPFAIFTRSCHNLCITVDSLSHWNKPGLGRSVSTALYGWGGEVSGIKMQTGMNLSKMGMNLPKTDMNLSKTIQAPYIIV